MTGRVAVSAVVVDLIKVAKIFFVAKHQVGLKNVGVSLIKGFFCTSVDPII